MSFFLARSPSSSTIPQSQYTPREADIKKLENLGIERKQAMHLLHRHHGDVEASADQAFSSKTENEPDERGSTNGSSSKPLHHSVLRSLPLGSMVPLGHQKSESTEHKPRKLGKEAAKYDKEADALVAGLFSRNDSTSSIPSQSTSSSRSHKEPKEADERHSRLRFPRFHRSTNYDKPPSNPTMPSSSSANLPSVSIESSAAHGDDDRGRNSKRLSTRSMSPFFARNGRSRSRARSPSPEQVEALRGRAGTSEVADSDSDEGALTESEAGDTLHSTSTGATSPHSPLPSDDEFEEDEEDEEDFWDEQTELNTESNAEASLIANSVGELPLSDLYIDTPIELGEGPNVVLPKPDLFPTPRGLPKAKDSIVAGRGERPELQTGRPEFGRDRCTLKLVQGEPEEVLEKKGKRQRRYVVASDLSEESLYAIEWAIGTVVRDGDEIWVVNVGEDESKVDPKDLATQDRVEKIRIQKERQTLAQMLSREVITLLQRTYLNVTVFCQAIHTKNSRHLLLDLIDFLDPTLVIVGSRGLGKLKGTILGSMSHYLVQKSSVPVMVARRRLRRSLKRTDPAILRQGARMPLAKAGIEKTAPGKEPQVDAFEIEREEDEREQGEAQDQRERVGEEIKREEHSLSSGAEANAPFATSTTAGRREDAMGQAI